LQLLSLELYESTLRIYTMIQTSIVELIRNGELGPLRHGLTHDRVRELLGSPPMWGPQRTEQRASIWRYGDIEFHFNNWVVSLIFSDHEDFTDGGPTLRIEPWIVRRGLSQDEFERNLKDMEVEFAVTKPDYDPSQTHVIVKSGIIFSFVDEAEEYCPDSGLVFWSTRYEG